MAAEVRKHGVNDRKCAELGWVSISLAVETYGCMLGQLGCMQKPSRSTISRLASRLAIQLPQCKQIQGHHYHLPTSQSNTVESKCSSFTFTFRLFQV